MSLFDKLKLDELNKVIYDLPFNKPHTDRNEVAHFCEHDGVFIRFTRARSTWLALAPCALKPWWLFLEPLRISKKKSKQHELTQQENHKKIINTK